MSHTTTEAVCPHCDGYGFRMVGVNRACCDVCEGRSTVPARDRATIAANIEETWFDSMDEINPLDWEGNVYGPQGAPTQTEVELNEMAKALGGV